MMIDFEIHGIGAWGPGFGSWAQLVDGVGHGRWADEAPLAVSQFQQQLLGTVGRATMVRHVRGPDLKLPGQLSPQRLGQIGHLLEGQGPLLEQPLAHLPRAIGWHSLIGKPGEQLVGRLLEEVEHERW